MVIFLKKILVCLFVLTMFSACSNSINPDLEPADTNKESIILKDLSANKKLSKLLKTSIKKSLQKGNEILENTKIQKVWRVN